VEAPHAVPRSGFALILSTALGNTSLAVRVRCRRQAAIESVCSSSQSASVSILSLIL